MLEKLKHLALVDAGEEVGREEGAKGGELRIRVVESAPVGREEAVAEG